MTLKSRLSDLLYPPTCLSCRSPLKERQHFCPECLEHFTLLPSQARCQKCFGEISEIMGVCSPCRKIPHPFSRLAACFETLGPAKSLLDAFLHQGQFRLAEEIAATIIVQLEKLGFPKFDLITTVPHFFSHKGEWVGKEVARMMGIPCKPFLKRSFTPYPHFSLKKKCNILNQTVLLLDIEMQSRETIRSAGWALDRGGPQQLFGITFCV